MAGHAWRPIFPIPPEAGTPNLEALSDFGHLDTHEIYDVQARLLGYVGIYNGKRYEDIYVPVQYGLNGAARPEWLPRPWTEASEFIRIAHGYIQRQLDGDPADGHSTLADIVAADYPEPRWLIPGLVPDGVTILAGPKGRGKSWISFDMVIAKAGGYMALGNIECGPPGDVLYLALEDNNRRIKSRALSLLQGKPPPRLLTVRTEWPNADDGGLEMIQDWIGAHPNAQGVVVDVLARIKGRPDRDKGIYDQDYETIVQFKRIALETSVPIVLVHHTNKAGNKSDPVLAVSGTMGLTGAADTVLVLDREANDPNGILYVRGRDVPEGEIALEFNKETGCCTRLGAADDFRKTEERRAIMRAIADGPLAPAEIAQLIGKRAGTVRVALHRMHKAGQIAKLADGRYGNFGA